MYMCVYTYAYVCIYAHTHIYIHSYSKKLKTNKAKAPLIPFIEHRFPLKKKKATSFHQ